MYDVTCVLHSTVRMCCFSYRLLVRTVRSLAVSGVAAASGKEDKLGERRLSNQSEKCVTIAVDTGRMDVSSLGLVSSQGVARLGYPPIGSIQVGVSCSSSWLSVVKTQISWSLWGGWAGQWFVRCASSYRDCTTYRVRAQYG